jgi:hypothetical protein
MTENLGSKMITQDNESSWRTFYDLFPLHSMLIQHWGIGHAQFVWNLRQSDKILNIWKHFWNTDELIVSFDGLSIHLPPETTNRGWYNVDKGGWLHSDQSYVDPGFQCIQSWVTAYDVNVGDATLSFLEGSNKYHTEFASKFKVTDKSNWYRLNAEEEYDFYIKEKGCARKAIQCPKGSLVFWDSRTIHCGQEAIKGRAIPNFRCVVYLCYSPRSYAKKKTLEKRIKYFKEMRMTTHWPHKVKVFSKVPRTYGKTIPNLKALPQPQLSEEGLKLVGY